ncbi:hypothetical protein NDU88_007120 [Pleurodeles waltl]|uniref:Uncharacterized protein n=1 Tax=Pleurodeles waltl TaxID=8319 RepID=A0AAV7NZZ5_PLEWA|nr:hypothetical protein NDU88_007120 [Pleurodeles waltl]
MPTLGPRARKYRTEGAQHARPPAKNINRCTSRARADRSARVGVGRGTTVPGDGQNCEHPENPSVDRKYPGGTRENVDTDPEVMGAAVTDIRRKNAEAERVFKPERNDRKEKEFSLGGEDGAVMSRPEQTPELRRHP